jgi:hypothetical protein
MTMRRPKGKTTDIHNQIMERVGRPFPKLPTSNKKNDRETQVIIEKNKKNIYSGY